MSRAGMPDSGRAGGDGMSWAGMPGSGARAVTA
jgi:hypothetical protein